MSYFPGLKLTKAGEQLLAKVSGNLSETISFRKAELGSGTIKSDDEIRFLTALKEKWKDVNISDCKIVGDEQTQVQIELQFDNAGINTNKIFRELGIYAAANDGREVLFAYSNAKENFDYIPAATDNPQSFVINILITITSNTKVNAQIDLNSYVTLRKFNEELAKKLDKGAVSSEYDTAKKIEDKIKTAQNTANNKLDKGTVSAEYNTAAKMEAKIKVAQQTATNAGSTANNKLTKGSLPAEITDAKGIYDLIENNSGLNFDPNLLFLNDAGTKTQDKIYFDRNKKGLFRCTQTTTATTNSTTYFEDISNKSSADRLTNLISIQVINDIIIKKYSNGIMEQFGYAYINNITNSGKSGTEFLVATYPEKFKKIISQIAVGYDQASLFVGAITISINNRHNLEKLYVVSIANSASKAISWHVVGTY